ncbi:MAG: T9SS type A sorting domain-containing protein, partial [Pseudomonadota bacterium]
QTNLKMKHILYQLIFNLFLAHIGFAQCFEPDAKIWQDTWRSCETQMNPNDMYGESHWIQYDFGAVRNLSKSWIWNTNDPAQLDQGFNRVRVDYSVDGIEWSSWGEMMFPKANGEAVYGGFPGPDLVGVKARYILITAFSNHGHSTCSGLAEVKFNLLPGEGEGAPAGCLGAREIEAPEIEEITTTEAIIYWEYALEDAYFLFLYREAGEEEWEEIDTDEPEIFLEDLEPGTEYEFLIATECGEQVVLSEMGRFTTQSEGGTTAIVENRIDLGRIRLFPNPAKSETILSYESDQAEDLQYVLTDTGGRTLLENTERMVPGVNRMRISLVDLPAGVYILRAISGQEQKYFTEKIIKVRQ